MGLTVECVANRQPFCNAYFDFDVQFKIPNGCVVKVHTPAPIPNHSIVWGEEIVLAPFEPYTYTSDNCDGYSFTYEAMVRQKNGDLRPLPQEIKFFPNNRTFVGSKCVQGRPETEEDLECLGMPVTHRYTVVIKATLVTAIQVFTDTSIAFDFVITPDCRADTLTMSSDFDVFHYHVTASNPATLTLFPVISQSIPTCQIECTLIEWGQSYYPNPPVIFFD